MRVHVGAVVLDVDEGLGGVLVVPEDVHEVVHALSAMSWKFGVVVVPFVRSSSSASLLLLLRMVLSVWDHNHGDAGDGCIHTKD